MAHKRPRNQSPNAVGLDGLTWPATRQTLDWYVTRARDGPWCRKSVFSVLAAPPRRAWFEAAAAINFIPHTGGSPLGHLTQQFTPTKLRVLRLSCAPSRLGG